MKRKFSQYSFVHLFSVVDFFNRVNLIYGTVCDYCTEKSCPVMSGGPRYEYLWCDPTSPQYKYVIHEKFYRHLEVDWRFI